MGGGQLASKLRTRREAPSSRRGSGGAAPDGVQGRSPWRGARGAEPPGKFLQKYRLKDHFLPIRKQEIGAS